LERTRKVGCKLEIEISEWGKLGGGELDMGAKPVSFNLKTSVFKIFKKRLIKTVLQLNLITLVI